MKNFKRTCFTFIALLFLPLVVNADLIEISDTGTHDGSWEITLIEGSFNSLADDLMNQPWWGDDELAFLFANALGEVMGIQNNPWGPFFAFDNTFSSEDVLINALVAGWNTELDPAMASLVKASPTRSFVWATGAPVRVPEPGTIGLLAMGIVGLGLARRRRRA